MSKKQSAWVSQFYIDIVIICIFNQYVISQKMAALIIESKNPQNLKILAALAKQLDDSVKPIDLSDI